jgi:hypothetical protein
MQKVVISASSANKIGLITILMGRATEGSWANRNPRETYKEEYLLTIGLELIP